MTARERQDELESQFAQWRHYVQRRPALRPSDADELEDHLRGSVDELVAAGLSPDEAFLVAVKRMGSLDELSREFAREHSERLWKQLVLTGETGSPAADPRSRRDLWVMVGCAAGAAVSVKVPELFGLRFDEDDWFYAPNFSLFALPWLAGFLAWRMPKHRPCHLPNARAQPSSHSSERPGIRRHRRSVSGANSSIGPRRGKRSSRCATCATRLRTS